MNKLLRKARDWSIIGGIAAIVGFAGYDYFVPDTVRTKITDAQMVKVDRKYMVATEYRPFHNHDAWYRFKFSSGSIQNEAIRLKGKEVEIRKYGWRCPIWSGYENIVSIREIK